MPGCGEEDEYLGRGGSLEDGDLYLCWNNCPGLAVVTCHHFTSIHRKLSQLEGIQFHPGKVDICQCHRVILQPGSGPHAPRRAGVGLPSPRMATSATPHIPGRDVSPADTSGQRDVVRPGDHPAVTQDACRPLLCQGKGKCNPSCVSTWRLVVSFARVSL